MTQGQSKVNKIAHSQEKGELQEKLFKILETRKKKQKQKTRGVP